MSTSILCTRRRRLRKSNPPAELGLENEPSIFTQQQVIFICKMHTLEHEDVACDIRQALCALN